MEMIQQGKHLPHTPDDLSSTPDAHIKDDVAGMSTIALFLR